MKPGFLSEKRIAFVGLGLMGGSLAMSLRGKCAHLTALEKDADTIAFARRAKIVDHISDRPEEIIPEADIIIFAAPVKAILAAIPKLPEWHPGPAFVIDLGSTKQQICTAMANLPDRFHVVGGHPMCGKEVSSLAHADPDLFQRAVFALCSMPSTTRADRDLAEALVTASGARPLWIDAEVHDQLVAATSHLPYLTANSLAAILTKEAKELIGPGLRSSTRLAASSPEMMTDIIVTNRTAILAQLSAFQSHLSQVQQIITSGSASEIQDILSTGQMQYNQLIAERGCA